MSATGRTASGTSPRPRVSVIMPTFEQAAFLPRAVGSLQVQTLQDWEPAQ